MEENKEMLKLLKDIREGRVNPEDLDEKTLDNFLAYMKEYIKEKMDEVKEINEETKRIEEETAQIEEEIKKVDEERKKLAKENEELENKIKQIADITTDYSEKIESIVGNLDEEE